MSFTSQILDDYLQLGLLPASLTGSDAFYSRPDVDLLQAEASGLHLGGDGDTEDVAGEDQAAS